MTDTIHLPRQLVNKMLHHAQEGGEQEVCGLIAGRDGKAVRCIPIPNTAEQPETRYAMDPEVQIDAMRGMRERGETLFAIYHSHPASTAYPSPTDLAQASYPEALYLIISLKTKGVLELRGFTLRDGEVREEALEFY